MAFPPVVRGVWRTRMSAPLPVRQFTPTFTAKVQKYISKLLVQQLGPYYGVAWMNSTFFNYWKIAVVVSDF